MKSESLKAQKSRETREAILSACLMLFAKHGFANTSIDDIGRSVNITKGAVYWHFQSKEELFQAILERIRDRWQQMILQPVSAEKSASARLQLLFDRYSQLFHETPEICVFLQRILLEDDQTFAPQVAAVFRKTARFIGRILEEGKVSNEFRGNFDSSLVAHGMLGSLSGATQQSIANQSLSLESLIQELKASTLIRVTGHHG